MLPPIRKAVCKQLCAWPCLRTSWSIQKAVLSASRQSRQHVASQPRALEPRSFEPRAFEPRAIKPGYLSQEHLSQGYLSQWYLSQGYLSQGYLSMVLEPRALEPRALEPILSVTVSTRLQVVRADQERCWRKVGAAVLGAERVGCCWQSGVRCDRRPKVCPSRFGLFGAWRG